MPPRASALSPEERRADLIAAAAPMVLADPTGFTTRRVAEAAGVAEGTLFRYFPTKVDLVEAVADHVLDPARAAQRLGAIQDDTLEGRVRAILALITDSMAEAVPVFAALRAHRPGSADDRAKDDHAEHEQHRARVLELDAVVADVLAPFADQLLLPPALVAVHLRALAFSTAHPMGEHHAGVSSDQLVHTFLYGVATPREH